MFRTVVFDMGNVLVHFSHQRMCQQLADVSGLDVPAMHRLLFDEKLNEQFERGDFDEEEYARRIEQRADRSVDRDAIYRACADIFVEVPGIRSILQELRAEGYRLVLLSNTNIHHHRFVERNFDLLRYFDAEVVSYRARSLKPAPGIYAETLRQLDGAAGAALYTDDIAVNLNAGQSFGLQGVLFTTAAAFRQDARQFGLRLAPAP